MLLAQLLAEDYRPDESLWNEVLISSRLLEYETWVRINARNLASSHGDAASRLLSRISFVELSPVVLDRVLEPFPAPARTLDAIHLATMEFLRKARIEVQLATLDRSMASLARAMDLPLSHLGSIDT